MSDFPSLYLLPIIAASTLRHRRGALLVAGVSAVFYLGIVLSQYTTLDTFPHWAVTADVGAAGAAVRAVRARHQPVRIRRPRDRSPARWPSGCALPGGAWSRPRKPSKTCVRSTSTSSTAWSAAWSPPTPTAGFSPSTARRRPSPACTWDRPSAATPLGSLGLPPHFVNRLSTLGRAAQPARRLRGADRGRPRHRARRHRGAAVVSRRPYRLPVHLPGRHRRQAPRARGSACASDCRRWARWPPASPTRSATRWRRCRARSRCCAPNCR